MYLNSSISLLRNDTTDLPDFSEDEDLENSTQNLNVEANFSENYSSLKTSELKVIFDYNLKNKKEEGANLFNFKNYLNSILFLVFFYNVFQDKYFSYFLEYEKGAFQTLSSSSRVAVELHSNPKFRTSSEVNKISPLRESIISACQKTISVGNYVKIAYPELENPDVPGDRQNLLSPADLMKYCRYAKECGLEIVFGLFLYNILKQKFFSLIFLEEVDLLKIFFR